LEVANAKIVELREQRDSNASEIEKVKELDKTRISTEKSRWEATIEDLSKELNIVQGEMTQKQTIHMQVERELRAKLLEVDDQAQHKSSLLRRIEELNTEVKTLSAAKTQKDQKLNLYVRRIEELQSDLE
jgi:hypothetical protein